MLQTMLFLVNYNTTNILDTTNNERIVPPQDSGAIRCYGVYGCFGVDGTLIFYDFVVLLSFRNNRWTTISRNIFILFSIGPWSENNRPKVLWVERLQFSDSFTFLNLFYLLSRFEIDFFYFHSLRPFNPSILNVKYPAFTNTHRNTPRFIDINDPETILRVGINPDHHIYFIAHGFLESGDRPWVRDLTNALLDYEKNATVVVVDWKGGEWHIW